MSSELIRILLIEDDEDDYISIKDLLSDISGTKYNLELKSSYQSGLDALKANHYDVCLLDHFLGEKTGLDLLTEVQALETCPIIFLTGLGDHDLDIKAMTTGASDYLVKGQITPDLLDRSLRYSIKHALDLKEIKEREIQILQQDRLASLGLLASSLAHEIGTPLGVIRGRAEFIVKKSSEDFVKKDMEIIVSQIDRVSKLVNSLLHIARGRHTESVTSISLNQVIQDVLNLMAHELYRKNIKLETDIPENILVKAESGPLGQVILNLLVNSVHAIEELGSRPDHRITIKALETGGYVTVSLQDTGCGIPQSNLSQLFKPFFTTKDIGVGTGLGLATSYKLMQSWNGSIQVESLEGHGANFTLKFING